MVYARRAGNDSCAILPTGESNKVFACSNEPKVIDAHRALQEEANPPSVTAYYPRTTLRRSLMWPRPPKFHTRATECDPLRK